MSRIVTLRVEVPDQFLANILTIAVESGISYWAGVISYRWLDVPPARVRAVITEHSHDDRQRILTIATIAHGLRRLLHPAFSLDEDTRRDITIDLAVILRDPTFHGAQIDAIDADAIVQAALFNQIRYRS
jgi:hypothetical protein